MVCFSSCLWWSDDEVMEWWSGAELHPHLQIFSLSFQPSLVGAVCVSNLTSWRCFEDLQDWGGWAAQVNLKNLDFKSHQQSSKKFYVGLISAEQLQLCAVSTASPWVRALLALGESPAAYSSGCIMEMLLRRKIDESSEVSSVSMCLRAESKTPQNNKQNNIHGPVVHFVCLMAKQTIKTWWRVCRRLLHVLRVTLNKVGLNIKGPLWSNKNPFQLFYWQTGYKVKAQPWRPNHESARLPVTQHFIHSSELFVFI